MSDWNEDMDAMPLDQYMESIGRPINYNMGSSTNDVQRGGEAPDEEYYKRKYYKYLKKYNNLLESLNN